MKDQIGGGIGTWGKELRDKVMFAWVGDSRLNALSLLRGRIGALQKVLERLI